MPVPGMTTCPRCEVVYDPRPVGHRCPVCSTPTPGHEGASKAPRDLALQLVAAATIGNLLLLSVLAVLLLR